MGNSKTILVIEDERKLLEVYKRKFSDIGLNVETAKTVQEGLTLAGHKPNLIILDIMLPGGKNGFEALASLKKDPVLKQIPVLVLTNLDSEKKTALDLGAMEYIVKTDIDIESLLDKVRDILKF